MYFVIHVENAIKTTKRGMNKVNVETAMYKIGELRSSINSVDQTLQCFNCTERDIKLLNEYRKEYIEEINKILNTELKEE